MACNYQQPITILEAIDKIRSNGYLLPALQRKYVWSSRQICVLFDSIMRGYPINTFMMWSVTDEYIKNEFKFYGFINDYCQRLRDENPHIPTDATFNNFEAIIDGQQRLTSIYIALCGTYAYKLPRVNWPQTIDHQRMPPRKLYLDLLNEYCDDDEEENLQYSFKFLTDVQYEESKTDPKHHWYCMTNILTRPRGEDLTRCFTTYVMPYLKEHAIEEVEYAQSTLLRAFEVIRHTPVINYFKEDSQKLDDVLDIFVRMNNGGTKLAYSDLLMSVVVTNWDGNFRREIDELTKQIQQSAEMGFYFERDWILKTCLMIINQEVKFRVMNFNKDKVQEIQKIWEEIKECILETAKLIRRFGINSESLTSHNAVIPIVYFLFHKESNNIKLYKTINDLAKHKRERSDISRWLYMALIRGVFGGQADSILSSMRKIIQDNLIEESFPLNQIVDHYKSTKKTIKFDNDYIESLLDTQYGDPTCRALLHLIFPEMNPTEIYHIDHLHPKVTFSREKLNEIDFLKNDVDLMTFYGDKRHWNSISNLHLLTDSQNTSKNAQPLSEWLKTQNTSWSALLVDQVFTDYSKFKDFYKLRREALKKRLIDNVFISDPKANEGQEHDDQEEPVDD